MELAAIALLAALNVQFALYWVFSGRVEVVEPPKPKAASRPLPKARAVTEAERVLAQSRDNRIHALIQCVDPNWKPGDPRDHINLVPGDDGHIERAELC
jgi:hypothetical protein